MKIKRALVSVYDKKGIIEFAKELERMGIEILSTGGTAKILKENNIKVTKIEDYTGQPEILDGRVKTLNFMIFGGILARQDSSKHLEQLQKMKIKPIDMVVVNLYPFEEMMKKKLSVDEMIEYIDIGGNTLLRAAAKNYKFALPVYDKKYYSVVINELKNNNGDVSDKLRLQLTKETFFFTSHYDSLISNYLSKASGEKEFPTLFSKFFEIAQPLRYGENFHQKAAYYKPYKETNIGFEQLWGKELSYNNILDFYAAVSLTAELKKEFSDKDVSVIVKHRNPCGAALASSVKSAYQKALAGDPVSAFGGIVSFSGTVDESVAKLINTQFYEIVCAKNFDKKALAILKQKKNLRIIKIPNMNGFLKKRALLNSVGDNLLVQDNDSEVWKEIKSITKKKATAQDIEQLKFGWIVCKYVKSNAIVYTKNFQLLGAGAGQMSRVDSAKFGAIKAKNFGFDLNGAYLASDAFFPFSDSVTVAAKSGVKAIIQPGGSIRDKEVIAEADKKGIAMVFTSMRHFNH